MPTSDQTCLHASIETSLLDAAAFAGDFDFLAGFAFVALAFLALAAEARDGFAMVESMEE